MGEAHSELKGPPLFIVSAERYNEGLGYWCRITLELPPQFDFSKRGAELLRKIESASRLFSEEES